MRSGRDWYDWHHQYDDADSPLSRRLRLIQGHIEAWLDERPQPILTVVSACAGHGRDLLEVLASRPDAQRVRGRLIEFDERNVAVASDFITRAGIANVTAERGDAGHLESYVGAVPADLVLLAGVLGNISDADAEATIRNLPQVCAAGATVIWTRSRRPPDRTRQIRRWFAETGFRERAFDGPDGVLFSVGVHVFGAAPKRLDRTRRLFRFLDS